MSVNLCEHLLLEQVGQPGLVLRTTGKCQIGELARPHVTGASQPARLYASVQQTAGKLRARQGYRLLELLRHMSTIERKALDNYKRMSQEIVTG